jgi:hypothetical protein
MEYKCDICNKNYKTYQTLWKHNKNFHTPTINQNQLLSTNNQLLSTKNQLVIYNIEPCKYNCRFCFKNYEKLQSRWKHEKTCKEKDKELSNVKQLELQLKIKEQEILKLKLKLQKSKKADIVTVNQLNKLLLERHKQYQNYINNINNGNINNYNGNVVNNIQLIGFGKEENIIERLTDKEKKLILNSRYKSLEKLIEIVHCGKYNEFKNILVTNAKDNYAYKYDSSKGQFVLSTKDEVINSLIDNRMYELETIYDSFLEENKIDEKTKDIIEIFINKINNDDTNYTDSDGNTHDTYKHYKVDQVKLILYNNKDKMISDISLILTTSSTNEIIM